MTSKRTATITLAVALTGCGGASSATTDTTAMRALPSAPAHPETELGALGGRFVHALAEPITSFGAATIGGRLFVAGGYHGAPHHYDRTGQSARLTSYDASFAPSEHAPLGETLQGVGLAAVGERLVVCGGSHAENGPGEPTSMRSSSSCALYDPAIDNYQGVASLSVPRSSFDMVAVGGKVYVLGGWQIEDDPRRGRFLDHYEVLDVATGTMTSHPQPFSRRAMAVAARGHEVIVVGGMGGDGEVTREVAVLDTETGTFSSGPTYPGDGFGVAAVGFGDRVFASGRDGIVYAWTRGEAAWVPVATLLQPRFFHRLIVSGEGASARLVAFGGIGSMTTDGRARLVEALPLVEGRPTQELGVGTVELAFPSTARNRSALALVEDSLVVVGGNDSPEQHDFGPENFVAQAMRLHVPSLRWFALPALPAGRQSSAAITLASSGDEAPVLVVLGGFGHDGTNARTFDTAFTLPLDGEAASFQVADASLPRRLTQFGSALHDGALFVFGGLDYDDARAEAERFDHRLEVHRCAVGGASGGGATAASLVHDCEVVASLPSSRRAFAGAALGEHFYIVGGMREGFQAVDDCLRFGFETRTFEPTACPRAPRVSADLVELSGKLYLAGGSSRTESGLSPDRSIEVFDPATGAFTVVHEALPFDTHQTRFLAYQGRLLSWSSQGDAGHARLGIIDVGAVR